MSSTPSPHLSTGLPAVSSSASLPTFSSTSIPTYSASSIPTYPTSSLPYRTCATSSTRPTPPYSSTNPSLLTTNLAVSTAAVTTGSGSNYRSPPIANPPNTSGLTAPGFKPTATGSGDQKTADSGFKPYRPSPPSGLNIPSTATVGGLSASTLPPIPAAGALTATSLPALPAGLTPTSLAHLPAAVGLPPTSLAPLPAGLSPGHPFLGGRPGGFPPAALLPGLNLPYG